MTYCFSAASELWLFDEKGITQMSTQTGPARSMRRIRLVLGLTWVVCVFIFWALLVVLQVARHYEWTELVSVLVVLLGAWSVIGPASIAFPAVQMIVQLELASQNSPEGKVPNESSR
jgi:hypothetical protein